MSEVYGVEEMSDGQQPIQTPTKPNDGLGLCIIMRPKKSMENR